MKVLIKTYIRSNSNDEKTENLLGIYKDEKINYILNKERIIFDFKTLSLEKKSEDIFLNILFKKSELTYISKSNNIKLKQKILIEKIERKENSIKINYVVSEEKFEYYLSWCIYEKNK